MAGETLHAEIQANASASSPIAQMARESLGLEGACGTAGDNDGEAVAGDTSVVELEEGHFVRGG